MILRLPAIVKDTRVFVSCCKFATSLPQIRSNEASSGEIAAAETNTLVSFTIP